jgi:hypothetical protein
MKAHARTDPQTGIPRQKPNYPDNPFSFYLKVFVVLAGPACATVAI